MSFKVRTSRVSRPRIVILACTTSCGLLLEGCGLWRGESVTFRPYRNNFSILSEHPILLGFVLYRLIDRLGELHTWYMGTLLALYWSFPSVYTNSVARAYFLPFRGLEGAGEGGKSCPSRSILRKAFPKPLSFPLELSGAGEEPEDMAIVLDDEIAEEGQFLYSRCDTGYNTEFLKLKAECSGGYGYRIVRSKIDVGHLWVKYAGTYISRRPILKSPLELRHRHLFRLVLRLLPARLKSLFCQLPQSQTVIMANCVWIKEILVSSFFESVISERARLTVCGGEALRDFITKN